MAAISAPLSHATHSITPIHCFAIFQFSTDLPIESLSQRLAPWQRSETEIYLIYNLEQSHCQPKLLKMRQWVSKFSESSFSGSSLDRSVCATASVLRLQLRRRSAAPRRPLAAPLAPALASLARLLHRLALSKTSPWRAPALPVGRTHATASAPTDSWRCWQRYGNYVRVMGALFAGVL